MTTLKQIYFASVLVFALLATATAQESTTAQRSSLTITAAAAGDRVRITAPSSVVQMRVEVYATGGEKLFDQEIRGGNVFDWHLQDGQAQRLAPGDYVCVVTAKSVSSKLTQKIGTVSVAEKSVSLQPAELKQLSATQAQTIGPVEENSSWMVAGEAEPQTPTVIAHDGTDGQMIRGRGALTFRIGNFFSGNDKEQMRLTEDGRLGIGTSNPQATLDVAGTIRAHRFFIARPGKTGSDDRMTSGDMAQATDAVDSVQPLIAGTGTLNNIAKWTPDGSTLGDSAITETAAGLVGIGTTSPNAKLTVNANAGITPTAPLGVIAHFVNADENNTFMTADSYGNSNIHSDFLFRRARGTMTAPTAVQANDIIGQIQARGYGATGFAATARASIRLGAAENWTNSAQGAYLSFFTTPNLSTTMAERMRITDAGNVGIGTIPTAGIRLDVSGAVLVNPTGVAGNPLIQFGTPNAETGMSIRKPTVGRADLRFDGSTLKLVVGADTGPPAATNGIAIDMAGNVGIGTAGPGLGAQLVVVKNSNFGSGDAVQAVASNGSGVYGQSVGRAGVEGYSGSGRGVWGESFDGTGVVALSNIGNLVEGYSIGAFSAEVRMFHITNAGTYVAGSDFAESLPARGDRAGYEPGDVLVVSTKAPGKIEKASRPYDPRVAGIYSTRPGMLGADKNGTSRVDKDEVPVAIVGIVPTKVSAINGRIRVGDLLTTSSTPGYAMRCANRVKCVGAIVGKALEPLAGGRGVIKVLVMLR